MRKGNCPEGKGWKTIQNSRIPLILQPPPLPDHVPHGMSCNSLFTIQKNPTSAANMKKKVFCIDFY